MSNKQFLSEMGKGPCEVRNDALPLEKRVKELEAALREAIYSIISNKGIVPPSARQALARDEAK